jgi:hypothetical protein
MWLSFPARAAQWWIVGALAKPRKLQAPHDGRGL